MRGRVVCKANALREERPIKVFGGRQKFHTAIPESPPAHNFAVVLRVVPAGGGVLGASGGKDGSKKGHGMISGEPRVNQMALRSNGTKLGAVRSGRGRTKTVLVKLSMTARASVSPVRARPWPWKSMEYRERGFVVVWPAKSPWARRRLPFSFSHSAHSASQRRTSAFMEGQK